MEIWGECNMPFPSKKPCEMLVKNLTIPVILDMEFLLCGVLDDKGQYVTYTNNFLNCFYIFSLKFVPQNRRQAK